MKLLADSADGAGYVLKDRIGDVRSSSARSGALPKGLRDRPDHRRDPPLQTPDRRPPRELTPRERQVLDGWPKAAPTKASPTSS